MKLKFRDRNQFEAAHEIIFNVNTRLDSAKNLKVLSYHEMVYEFEDESMAQRAIERLQKRALTKFDISV